jgi:tRNA nucleotidyltransferase (CCA-adding enzyme)
MNSIVMRMSPGLASSLSPAAIGADRRGIRSAVRRIFPRALQRRESRTPLSVLPTGVADHGLQVVADARPFLRVERFPSRADERRFSGKQRPPEILELHRFGHGDASILLPGSIIEPETDMHLILTHDQADFDAVAALLAARLLEPESMAVLPHRLNRNVQAFLALYGDALPFDIADDLPREPVERVTLVDTHSMPAIRGVGKQTRVHIVDHHDMHKPVPAGWVAAVDSVGACTTLLVESLETLALTLSAEEATLLILGIYEDTGSLSYGGTTPRDVRAAAWLLEQGANLSLATGFLNHPLSDSQRELYDRLLESAEIRIVQGRRILLAHASAAEGVEEISTLAHKLRDLFNPDGLFVLVEMGSHVQMVARSTTDSIDVSEIAARFGGGGHDRAAAALIRGRSLAELRRELVDALSTSIAPPIQVAQIYSPRPQVVESDLSVEEAAERMARYGYEGFPVVREGKVVGLLTRRAVDRAVAHGMKRAHAENVMEGGSVTVQLTDSIAHLQQLMVEQGWGQIPVVSPEGDRVVGIVTRTDLIKAMAPGRVGMSAGRLNLRDRLERGFPPVRLALLRAAASVADRQHTPLYLVGGVVRDLVLNIPSYDLDLVVEGDAIALARSVAQEFGGRVRSHDRFGTAKWLLRGVDLGKMNLPVETAAGLPESLDMVSARAEFYPHPSALPEVERGNLKLDLHRRDFTINTLSLSLNAAHFGQVNDFWGGLRDLEEKRIRVLHSISFIDDPTRILRAVRLEQRLGFQIEPRTRDLIARALPLLHRVSGDRVRHELEAIFGEPTPENALRRLQELEVLARIHPRLQWNPADAKHVRDARSFTPDPRWALVADGGAAFPPLYAWLLGHPADALDRILDRLNVPRREANSILDARRALDRLIVLPDDAPPSRVAEELEDTPEQALVGAYLLADGLVRERLDRYLADWRRIQPETDGTLLRRLGLPPGPRYRDVLRALRNARLDGQVSTAEEETRMLNRLLADLPRKPDAGRGDP